MEMKPYIVYVKVSDSGYIIDINSSAFLADLSGWVAIDEGFGDEHHHAQNNYLPKPIITDGGAYRYKMFYGDAVECSAEEIAEQEEGNKPVPEASTDDVLNVLLGVT